MPLPWLSTWFGVHERVILLLVSRELLFDSWPVLRVASVFGGLWAAVLFCNAT